MGRNPIPEQQRERHSMNHYQALVLALRLAITAPTESKAQECVSMAEQIAQCLTPDDIEQAKIEATREA